MGLKFKLPDQDSEGGKNWTVRLEVKFMLTETVLILEELFSSQVHANRNGFDFGGTFLTRDVQEEYSRKEMCNSKNRLRL